MGAPSSWTATTRCSRWRRALCFQALGVDWLVIRSKVGGSHEGFHQAGLQRQDPADGGGSSRIKGCIVLNYVKKTLKMEVGPVQRCGSRLWVWGLGYLTVLSRD